MSKNTKIKTIETASHSETKNLFSTRNIIILCVLFAVMIGLIIYAALGLLQINFNEMFNTIGKTLSSGGLGGLWLTLLIFFPFIKSFYFSFVYFIRLKEDKIKVSMWEWLFFGGCFLFITSIVPLALGGPMYALFWLKTKGYDTAKATALSMTTGLIGWLMQIIITWPSFIYISTFSGINDIWNVYWLVVLGIILDMVVTACIFAILFTKKINFWLSYVFNTIKKWLKVSYHTKDQIWKKYYKDETLRRHAYYYFVTKWKGTLAIFAINFVYCFSLYGEVYCGFALVATPAEFAQIDFITLFSCTNITITANNFIPLPGGEGTTQLVLTALLSATGLNLNDDSSTIAYTIMTWRSFTFYLPLVISSIGFGTMIYRHTKNFKKNKILFNSSTVNCKKENNVLEPIKQKKSVKKSSTDKPATTI